jgi:tetratricopeptide (TPR) repeat protein
MKNKQASIPRNELEKIYLMYSMSQFQDAIKYIKILNEKYPNQPLLFNLIGACYKSSGQLEGAAKMFGIAVKLNPNYSEAYFNLGCIYQDLNQAKSAMVSYKKAIEIKPNYAEAYNNLGNILRELGDFKASVESLEWAIAYKHDYAEAHNNLGSALNDSGRMKDAIRSFERAISFKSNYAKAIFNLALAYKDMGKKDLWLKMTHRTLLIEPKWSNAHLEFSRIKKYTKNDPHIIQVHELLSDKKLSVNDVINYNFALANAYESIKDYGRQFEHLNEAKHLRKKESGYIIDNDKILFSNIKETFKNRPYCLENSIIKDKDIRPIFILGMPRSGTSLVHQIISNHHLVFGAGELTKLYKFVMPYVNDKQNTNISKENLLLIRKQYLDYLSNLGVQENIIIDKMPLNFRFIGFIIAAFPEAKIIHMTRNPMATCWSIYKNYFPGNSYSYNQKDTATYYLMYQNLMDFWNRLYPNKIYDFCYEELTSNQQEQTTNLLKYCELDWDNNCLEFDANDTVMKTTSSMQVKKKMYQGSSEVWKKYESYLEPLIKGLDYH